MYGDPVNSQTESQIMPDGAGNNLQQFTSMRAAADCSLRAQVCSATSAFVPNKSAESRQKCMRRGYVLPATRSCTEHLESQSAADCAHKYNKNTGNSSSLKSASFALCLPSATCDYTNFCREEFANHAGQRKVAAGDLHHSA